MLDPEIKSQPRLRQALTKTADWAKSLYDDFKEFLSPSACLCCGRERDFPDPLLCPKCIEILTRENCGNGPICPICARTIGTKSSCERCRGPKPLDLYYWGIYDKELKDCLLQFKFHGALELGKRLSGMAAVSLGERLAGNKYDLLIPVPLHKGRERERSFNQSEIIARELAQALNIEIQNHLLTRSKATDQQAKLAEKERWNNVMNAFDISSDSRELIASKNILLIDDIVTTGATVYEASRPLLEAGVKRLDIFSLAYAK